MAKSVNKVMLLGHVGKDPEAKATSSGVTVVNFSLATSERIKDQSGNWTDRAEWHSLVAFKGVAEVIRDYVHKGSKLFVEGKLITRSWDDKETHKKVYKTEVLVQEVSLLDGRSDQNSNGNSSGRYQRDEGRNNDSIAYAHADGGRQDDYGDLGINSDDIPF
jgi:single-strand DNA-binding protein